jgi:hypothetical protein
MEPFAILAIAAVVLIVFYLVWSNRSRKSTTRPEIVTPPQHKDRDLA